MIVGALLIWQKQEAASLILASEIKKASFQDFEHHQPMFEPVCQIYRYVIYKWILRR